MRISSSVMASKHYAPSMLREVSNTANTNGETTARKSTRRAGGGGGGTAEQNQQQHYHQSSMMPADATTRDNANTSEKRWQVRRKLFQRKKSRDDVLSLVCRLRVQIFLCVSRAPSRSFPTPATRQKDQRWIFERKSDARRAVLTVSFHEYDSFL